MRATVAGSEVVAVAVVAGSEAVAAAAAAVDAAAVGAGSAVVDNTHLDNQLSVDLDCGSGSYQTDKKAALYAFLINGPIASLR